MVAKDSRDLQLWGGVAVVGAALAVVAGYLVDGAPLVWAVASVEVLLVMVYVGRRFRHLVHPRAVVTDRGAPSDAAHCERCRRARELRDGLASNRADPARPVSGRPLSARHAVGHQRDTHVLHDEGPEGEGVEDLVEPEPSR